MNEQVVFVPMYHVYFVSTDNILCAHVKCNIQYDGTVYSLLCMLFKEHGIKYQPMHIIYTYIHV
jgi:hypothetical protein